MSARKAQMVLDLTGLWDTPALPVQTTHPSKPSKPSKPSRHSKPRRKWTHAVWVVAALVVCWALYRFATRTPKHRIRRVTCKRKHGDFVCTLSPKDTGDVIVEMSEDCAQHVFEIGGYPFTHAKWKHMFRVPAAPQVVIKDAYAGCTPRVFLDSKVRLRLPTQDLVWCASGDHNSFTVTVDSETVLEEAGGALLDPQHNGAWTCYVYSLTDTHPRQVQVNGNGQSQIHVYTRPSIMAS